MSEEREGRDGLYQHVSISAKDRQPTRDEAAVVLAALTAAGHIGDEQRTEVPAPLNPRVRHFVPARLFR